MEIGCGILREVGGEQIETSRTFLAACRVAEGVLWPHAARRWSHLVLHGVST